MNILLSGNVFFAPYPQVEKLKYFQKRPHYCSFQVAPPEPVVHIFLPYKQGAALEQIG